MTNPIFQRITGKGQIWKRKNYFNKDSFILSKMSRILSLIFIFASLFLLSCCFAYLSYCKTIFHVETVEINIFHNSLPTQLAHILKLNDRASLKRVLESNYSLFGIVVTSKNADKIIAVNNEAERKNININILKDIREPYDEIVWPPDPSYYNALYPHAYATNAFVNTNQIGQEKEIIGRIYYLRGNFPSFLNSLLLWPKKLFTGYYRIWLLLFPIFVFIALSSIVSLELIISNNSKRRKILEQELELKRIEHKNLIVRLEGLERAIDKSTGEKANLEALVEKNTENTGRIQSVLLEKENEIKELQKKINEAQLIIVEAESILKDKTWAWYLKIFYNPYLKNRGLFIGGYNKLSAFKIKILLNELKNRKKTAIISNEEIERLCKKLYSEKREQTKLDSIREHYSSRECLIIQNFNPTSFGYLWFLYNFIIMPRYKSDRPTFIISQYGKERLYSQCSEMKDERIKVSLTWDKLAWVLNQCMYFVDLARGELSDLSEAEIPMTPIEQMIAYELKNRKIFFLPQYRISSYYVDFALPGQKIVIECDGSYYHDKEKDDLRDRRLREEGWHVIRFTGSEIFTDVKSCAKRIESYIEEKSEEDSDASQEIIYEGDRKLDKSQREAVEVGDGPSLIIAPAGSGKTTVIVHRIIYLLSKGIFPRDILVLTFSKNTRQDIQEGLKKLNILLPVEVRTFHSLGYQILSLEGKKFELVKAWKKEALIRKFISDFNKEKDIIRPIERQEVMNFIRDISRLKLEYFISQEEFEPKTDYGRKLKYLYDEYETYKEKNNVIDYNDMLYKTVQLFIKDNDIRHRWQGRYKYILVDEFQDVDQSQEAILKILAVPFDNIFVVGDDDQTIYSWRFAKVERILNFHSHYPFIKKSLLEFNYRCPKAVVEASKKLIDHNVYRFKKKIVAGNLDSNCNIEIIKQTSEKSEEESKNIAVRIKELLGRGYTYKDIIVLFRTNAQSLELEKYFALNSIPYNILGDRPSFFEFTEIKIILAYLRMIAAPLKEIQPDDLRLIINRPNRYVSGEMVEKLIENFRKGDKANIDELLNGIKGEAWRLKHLKSFLSLLLAIKKEKSNLSALIRGIRERFGINNYYNSEAVIIDTDSPVSENLDMLERFASKYTDLKDFIQATSAMTMQMASISKDVSGITISTIHSAKGLGFPVVFVIGLTNGIMPHKKSLNESKNKNMAYEEERRLCYVAITRCSKGLFLSFDYKNPSPFIEEMGIIAYNNN